MKVCGLELNLLYAQELHKTNSVLAVNSVASGFRKKWSLQRKSCCFGVVSKNRLEKVLNFPLYIFCIFICKNSPICRGVFYFKKKLYYYKIYQIINFISSFEMKSKYYNYYFFSKLFVIG